MAEGEQLAFTYTPEPVRFAWSDSLLFYGDSPAWDNGRCQHATEGGRRCARTGYRNTLGWVLCGQHSQGLRDEVEAWLQSDDAKQAFRHLHDCIFLPPSASTPHRVYFFEREGFIKIGTSTDVPTRRRTISKGSQMMAGMTVGPVRVLATMPGGQKQERLLHGRFAHLRVDLEWFSPGDDLCEFMEHLYDADPDLIDEVRIRATEATG